MKIMGLPVGSDGEESDCNARDSGDSSLIPGLGRSLEEKLEIHEYSCLENSMAGYSPWGHKQLDPTEHTCTL